MTHSIEKKPGLIRRFFSLLGRLGSALRTMLNLAFLLLFIVLITSLFQENIQPLPEKAALRLNLQGIIVDQKTYTDPFSQALQKNNQIATETLLRDVIDAINSAATDPRITSLVLDLNHLQGAGLSKLEEIGQALSDFKQSEKIIIAHGDNFTQGQYYLASFADEVHLNPMGSIIITGFGNYPNYYKGLLDKLKINVNVFRVGEYKDAIEPFSRTSMSRSSKEHNSEWLNTLWQLFSSKIEQQRNLPSHAINDYANNIASKMLSHGGDAAEMAKQAGLVDQLSTRPQLLTRLQKLAGHDNGSYRQITLRQYASHLRRKEALPKASLEVESTQNRIGVIIAKGSISDGEQMQGSIGGDSLTKLLKEVKSGRYKALVLRVDSPGGSAFASEIIRQQIQTVQIHTPVIISMSSVAASGGYWIAADADQVWANPSTITGSIGVFGIVPTFEDSLKAIGITSDGLGTTDIADIMHLDRPMSNQAKQVLQLSVENIYRQFLNLVADARNSTPEAIHEIAQGRVWTGVKAQELGLVDKLGTLKDAIAGAAEHVGVTDYDVEYIKPPMTIYEQFLHQLATGSATVLANIGLGEWATSAFNTQQPAVLRQLQTLLNDPTFDLLFNTKNTFNDPRHLYLECFECNGI